MGKKSSDKGGRFERDLSRDFSLWISGGMDAYIFSRRYGGGGSKRDKEGLSGSGGDICADKREGEWLTNHALIEAKFYKDLKAPLWNFLVGNGSIIDGFIKQARDAALVYDRKWILVIKTNLLDPLLITNSEVIGKVIKNKIVYTNKNKFYICSLKSFLSIKSINLKNKLEGK